MNAEHAKTGKDQDIHNANLATEKAYKAIVTEVKKLLKHFPTETLRTYVERTGTNNNSQSFYCLPAYISIGEYYGKTIISFAKNMQIKQHVGAELDTQISRMIYEQTSQDRTKINIEDRLDEYMYYRQKYDDALKHSANLENYKLAVANDEAKG